jgi:hypothetical protein
VDAKTRANCAFLAKVKLQEACGRNSEAFIQFLEWLYQSEGVSYDEELDQYIDEEPEITDGVGMQWMRGRTGYNYPDDSGILTRKAREPKALRQATYLGRFVDVDGEEEFREAPIEMVLIEQNPERMQSEGGKLVAEGYEVAQVIIDGEYVGMIVSKGDQAALRFYPGKAPRAEEA